MSNPMPGWYPDPEAPERQRFWDGTKWTEARAYPVAGADGAAAPAGAAPAGAPVPDEKRKSNPWIVIALIAVLVALLFAAAWFFLLRGDDSSEDLGPVPKGTPTAAPVTPTLPATPTPTPTATKKN
jgi:hypothetical protein